MSKYVFLFGVLTALYSCIGNNIAIQKGTKSNRLENYKVFVVTDKNDTIQGAKWNIKFRRKQWHVIIDGKEFVDSSIVGFQSKDGLAIRYRSSREAHSFIDQWAYYVKRGKINVFSNQRFMGVSSSYDRQSGTWTKSDRYKTMIYYQVNGGSLLELDTKNLKTLINDDPEALDLFKKSNINDGFSFYKKALSVIDVYNKNKKKSV